MILLAWIEWQQKNKNSFPFPKCAKEKLKRSIMTTTHFFNLGALKAQKTYPGGSRALLTTNEFPILQNLSIALVKLAKGSIREPHWHPNANEMSYCVKGQAKMTIFSPGSNHDTFTLSPGEISFVPKGSIHHISNIGDEEVLFLTVFSHSQPEDLDLSDSLHAMANHVLASTFEMPKEFFRKLKEVPSEVFIASSSTPQPPPLCNLPNRFKLNVEDINPQIIREAGSAKIANLYTFPVLEDLALFSLRMTPEGIREPHWHPNAHELNYVIKGRAKLTILSPDGGIDTGEVGPQEGSFIPASYLHHIENISSEELHMAVFFSHALPSDIGLSGALSAYSNEDLATVFSVAPDMFKSLKRFSKNRMIVSKDKGKDSGRTG
jgi:oxalate decarboxylase